MSWSMSKHGKVSEVAQNLDAAFGLVNCRYDPSPEARLKEKAFHLVGEVLATYSDQESGVDIACEGGAGHLPDTQTLRISIAPCDLSKPPQGE